MASQYAHPEVLVSTVWVEEHRQDANVRIVESDEDVLLYLQGHVPGAVKIDWHTDLQDAVVRDYIGQATFAALCARKGIANDTTVVFYGDKNNWWACYAFWTFKLYGHSDCRVMNGGRRRWELDGRAWSRDPEPTYPPSQYTAQQPDPSIRAFRDEVLRHQRAGKPLVDVRSPGEYTGEMLHMPDYPQEGALRGGHIPGAVGIPWSRAVNEDGTFKSAKELEKLYVKECGLKRRSATVAYCRIGERSSHTWFVLKYLLGFQNVKNYDGSWTEWGNAVGLPIAQGPNPQGGRQQDDAPQGDGPQAERSGGYAVTVQPESVGERIAAVAEEFRELAPRERLELLLEFAEKLPPLPAEYQAERERAEHRVHECQTPVYLWVQVVDDRVQILADVAPEAPTVRGFVAILAEAFCGGRTAEVLAVEPNLVQRLGLVEALGMMRMRGLQAILFYVRNQIRRVLES